ncbi:MAG: beta-ketoacyl-[acyl-carrier-protein] synthase family protein [Rhodocyclales bacterium]|nr:beta-ketoacyl-[acyl-carrier-protein] synthase family protein [Rhodocyclales bacterium]
MGKRRVAITGLGLVSPFGGDTADFFARLARGESAIRHYTTDDKPRPLSVPAVRCTGFDADAALGKPLAGTMDRFSHLGMAAAFEAWEAAGFARGDKNAGQYDFDAFGVSWGTALGGTLAYERGYRDLWLHGRERLSPLAVVLGMNNAAAAHIAIQLGLGNSCLSYTVACSSAAAAIGEGYRRIRDGEATLMLTGGCDAPLAYGVVRAWENLRVLAPGNAETSYKACRPFSADRAGLVLGEGAAALVLEDWEHAVARGAPILAELAGYGATCDHGHLVKPDAAGQVRAMKLALADAGLAADEIDYVNAHGTATREGDPTEIVALKTLFGERAATLPVSATKSTHGHLMGAAGAIEALVTVLALQHDTLPPTAHLDSIDPDCQGVRHITGAALTGTGARAALSNSFAFGGSNAVLAFRSLRAVR